LFGGAVQHCIDVFVCIGAAKALAQIHSFVDHDAIRYIESLLQFEGAQHQYCAFHGIQLFEWTIDQTGERAIQLCAAVDAAAHQLIEVITIHTASFIAF
jgi:hypothetical protein